jgi:protein-S-isoprenylcysteine O-methyltransferase Ste14
MPLIEEFERSGVWLFRWRSYLPFVFLPLIFLAATRYPTIEANPSLHLAWGIFSLGVSLLGLFVRCHSVGHAAEGTSGRNTKKQIAESLNTSGFYSVLRHPLYFGNFLIALGIVMHSLSPWLIAIYVMSFALYYERIMFTEEAFLRQKFGREFIRWANRTPAFVPRIRRWRSAELPMNWPKVIRAESAAVGVSGTGILDAPNAAREGRRRNLVVSRLRCWPIALWRCPDHETSISALGEVRRHHD